jgi:hypothetical protein
MGHYIKDFLVAKKQACAGEGRGVGKGQMNKEACHLQDCRVELC